MNPDQPSREQIEARITALLLGELPAAEAELLRWSIAQDPELQKLHDQLKLTMGFVREAMKNPTGAPVERETPLQLPQERRRALLAHFKTVRPQKSFWLRRLEIPSARSLATVAIAFLMICMLAVIAVPNFVKTRSTSQANAIINNLRQIDAAKQEWALEEKKSANDVPTANDLTPYLQQGMRSVAGEKYVLGKVSEPTVADINGKQLTSAPANSGGVNLAYQTGANGWELRNDRVSGSPNSAVVKHELEGTTPPVRIALPNTESTQVRSQQEAGTEVYSQSIVGYVNASLGPSSTGSSPAPAPKTDLAFASASAPTATPPSQEPNAGGRLPVFNGLIQEPKDRLQSQDEKSSGSGNSFYQNDGGAIKSWLGATQLVLDGDRNIGLSLPVDHNSPLAQVETNFLSLNTVTAGGVGFADGSVAKNPFSSRLQSVLNHVTNGTPSDAAMLARDGQMLYEMGKLEEAEGKLGEALRLDPENRSANYYSELTKQAREAREDKHQHIDNLDRMVQVERASEKPATILQANKTSTPPQVASLPQSIFASSGQVNDQTVNGVLATRESQNANTVTENSGSQTEMRATVIQTNMTGFNFTAAPTAMQPPKGAPQQYEMKTLKVDPNTFYAGLQNVGSVTFGSLNPTSFGGGGNGQGQSGAAVPVVNVSPGAGTARQTTGGGGLMYVTTPNQTRDVSGLAKQYFSSLGVKLDPPKTVFYNDRLGVLFVYATPQDLDTIGHAIQDLNKAPPQLPQPVYDTLSGTGQGQSYEELKAQLDSKIELHTLLAARIKNDKADSAIPKSSMVTIVEPAQAAQSKNLWQRLTGEVESQARIKVEPDNISDVPTSAGAGAVAPYEPYFLETEFNSIRSDAVLGKVVDGLKLDQAWSKQDGSEKLSRKDAITLLRSRLDLQTEKDTRQVEIGAKSDKADEAVKIANAVTEAYKQYRIEMHRQEMSGGINVLQQQYAEEDKNIREMQAELEQMETSASAPQTGQPMTDARSNLADNEMIPPGLINFQGADVNQVLDVYAQLVGRTLLRTGLPDAKIFLKTETPQTKAEVIQTLQKALALHGIAVVNVGDKFVKVVPVSEAGAAAEQTDRPLPAPKASAPIPQPEVQTHDNAFSTFSLNVSDVSFKLASASLGNGQMPAPASIRSEEFINAFDYHDPEPLQGEPLSFVSERASDPFAQERDLLRFSIKAAALGRQEGRALNLVLLLDTSGSMERADRVAIIREALRVLSAQLQPRDTVSVVTFARTARLWADGVRGDQAGATLDKVGSITPEGGTNLEEAMRLAYETALHHFIAGGINRVVLLTDGAANLGNVDSQTLTQKVEAERRHGIALDCFGIGWDDYNDDLLEQLSSNGDGRYAFINSPDEAGTEFAAKLAGALQVAAEDVKVQVEFNPNRVTAWRQIGYAKHQLTKEQFRDNTVAAGAIAAREAGNALYVIETRPEGEGPIATVRVRYRVPGTQDNRERSWLVDYTGAAPTLAQSSPAMRLNATAAEFSEWLADSPFAQDVTLDELLNYLSGVPQFYGTDDHPKQLEWMIRQAKSVSGK